MKSVNYSTSDRYLLTASWIYPVTSSPIANGGLLIERGNIVRLLDASQIEALQKSEPDLHHTHIDRGALTPGLINLHTHLDYTNLVDLATFEGETMFDWLEELVGRSRAHLNSAEILFASALAGAAEAALTGTTMVVDSTFSGAAAHGLAAVGLKGLVGLELFGLNEKLTDMLFGLWLDRLAALEKDHTAGGALQEALASGRLFLTIAPHAPYTVAPALWSKALDWAKEKNLPLTCHLAESLSEWQWIAAKNDRLEAYLLKVMPKNPQKDPQEAMADLTAMLTNLSWRNQGLSPTAHLHSHNLLNDRTIAAHCVHLDSDDAKKLADQGVKIALCPRSNVGLKNGLPNPRLLFDADLTVGMGTDSRASTPSLSLLEESRFLREKLPDHLTDDYHHLLRMLTIEGARALHMEKRTGSLEAGKAADIAVFTLPERAQTDEVKRSADCDTALATLFEKAPACTLLLVDGKTIVSQGLLVQGHGGV